MAPQRTAASNGPAARTRAAAAQQHQRAAADVAWPLLLQHDSVRTQLPIACKLLCCSKWLAAAVAEHTTGQLDLPWFDTIEEDAEQAKTQQAATWLRKHARLVRSLNLRCDEPCVEALMWELVAAGLHSLALQSLQVYTTDSTLVLLEQLPASRLTELDLSISQHVARVSAALGRLTALRSLQLTRTTYDKRHLSGLAALTQLTALCFDVPLSDLQHVPPQLLQLDLDSYRGQQSLDLRHLAAVTALRILYEKLAVMEGNGLPPNLLRLRLNTCKSAQPLLPRCSCRSCNWGLAVIQTQCLASRPTSCGTSAGSQH